MNNEPQDVSFPFKLHRLLDTMEQKGQTDIISWIKEGNKDCFQIHDREKFANEVLPLFFGTNRVKSFQRNLNIWGFVSGKKRQERGIYAHKDFVRGHPELCFAMRRKQIGGSIGEDNDPASRVAIHRSIIPSPLRKEQGSEGQCKRDETGKLPSKDLQREDHQGSKSRTMSSSSVSENIPKEQKQREEATEDSRYPRLVASSSTTAVSSPAVAAAAAGNSAHEETYANDLGRLALLGTCRFAILEALLDGITTANIFQQTDPASRPQEHNAPLRYSSTAAGARCTTSSSATNIHTPPPPPPSQSMMVLSLWLEGRKVDSRFNSSALMPATTLTRNGAVATSADIISAYIRSKLLPVEAPSASAAASVPAGLLLNLSSSASQQLGVGSVPGILQQEDPAAAAAAMRRSHNEIRGEFLQASIIMNLLKEYVAAQNINR